MARTIPFIVLAGVITLAIAAASFAEFSPARVLFVIVGGAVVMLALFARVGSFVDRWAPPFPRVRLDSAERSASSVDLESETQLDRRWGYHFDLGGNSEEPWAPCPLAWEFSYVQDWVARHAPLLLNEAGVVHKCEVKGNIVRAVIPRLRDSGFDIIVEAVTFGVLVRTGTLFQAHFHLSTGIDYDYDEHEEIVDPYASREPAEQALGLVRDLLSPAVRIPERRAAGVPYDAALEARLGGEWRRRRAVALLRYPYWGRREECVWTNTHLDPRAAE